MDRSDVAVAVDGFTGEVERLVNRVAETTVRVDAADANIAVCAAGPRVGRPVVRVP
jgi:hypothetical protein